MQQQLCNRGRDSQQGQGTPRRRSQSCGRAATPPCAGQAQTSILHTKVQLGAGKPVDVRVESTTRPVRTTTQRVLHITFLIDASASMMDATMHGGRCKLDVVLDNVQRMVADMLQPADRITVLMFHSVPEQLCYNMPVSKLRMAAVRAAAHELMKRSQGTCLYYSTVKALAIMKSIADTTPGVTVLGNGDKEVVLRKLVVFTDGQDNSQAFHPDQVYVERGHKIRCTLDTVLHRLAAPGMGAFHFTLIAVGSPQELRDAVALRALLERHRLSQTCAVITELRDVNKAFNVVRTKIKQMMMLETVSIKAQHKNKGPVMGGLLDAFVKQQAGGNGHKLLVVPAQACVPAGAGGRSQSCGRGGRRSSCRHHG